MSKDFLTCDQVNTKFGITNSTGGGGQELPLSQRVI